MVKLILRVFRAFAWALGWVRVDPAQFYALLEIKLTLDERRQQTAFQSRPGRASRRTFEFTLLMNVFLGGAVCGLIFGLNSPLVALTLIHSFIMLMIALSLIADFSSVLLDTTDSQILQPRPISGRTILAARMAHVITYIALLTLSVSAATFVTGTIRLGPAFPFVFALTLVAAVGLVVSVVNVLYLAAMRLTTGERLRDIILYFQVAMTILAVAAYQILPRLLPMLPRETMHLADQWWVYFVPPAWLAAPIDLLAGHRGLPLLVLTGLGLIVPLASFMTVMALAPGFKAALVRLEAASTKTAPRRTHGRGGTGSGWARCLTRTPVERAAFEMTWALCGRDRQFKLRTYPSIGLIFILAGGFILSSATNWRETLATLPTTQKHLLLLYVCCALAPMTLMQIRFSDRYEAAWLYRVLPLERPGPVLLAALKVLLVRLIGPAFALVAIVTLAIWGRRVVSDLVLAFLMTLLITVLQAFLLGRRFPFSEPYGVLEGSGRMTRSLLFMIMPLAAGWLHYALLRIEFGVVTAIPFVAAAVVVIVWLYGRTNWPSVLAEADDGRVATVPAQLH